MATILVCDESATIRISLTHRLASKGHIVSGCRTIADSWHALQDGAIDLVVVSRELSDGMADDLIDRMRRCDATAALPVAICTAPDELPHSGPSAYLLPRPANRADIEAMLAALLPKTAA
jgi:DNA-binding response OmpR family regulator